MVPQGNHSPVDATDEKGLIDAAVGGNPIALEKLLLAHYDSLAQHVAARLPARLQATQAVEDILQVTFCHAFRDITTYHTQSGATFGHWLSKIAEHRLLDAIKQHDAVKRGGDHQQIQTSSDSRVAPILDWIASHDRSASSVIARDEAVQALQVALASLPADQRDAIRLRHLEGKSLDETAATLGRTPAAVRGLVHRGKQLLQDALGRASRWLKSK